MLGNSARRSGLGIGGNRGVAAPQRSAPPSSERTSRGAGGGERKSSWTTVTNFYDPYHSAMEPQIVADLYRTSLAVKLSPVFAERRGPDDGGDGKKYDRDNQLMIVMELHECMVFRHQLEAFINGQLAEVTVERGTTGKRLVLCSAGALYDASHPEYEAHAGEQTMGLALIIEQDPDGRTNGGSCVFISRLARVVLQDGADPVAFYPELQGLLAVIDSFIQNCARVDFASTRTLSFGGGEREAREPGPTATMPTRRTGGLGAPVSRPAPTSGGGLDPADDPSAGSDAPAPAASAPARRPAATVQAGVSDTDLSAALGDTPQF